MQDEDATRPGEEADLEATPGGAVSDLASKRGVGEVAPANASPSGASSAPPSALPGADTELAAAELAAAELAADESAAATSSPAGDPEPSILRPVVELGEEQGGWRRRTDGECPDLSDVEREWDRLEELPGAEVLKSNLSRQVIALPATDRRPALLVKRYRVRGRAERWKYALLPSRAAREWRALAELEAADFPTPQPYARFESRKGRWLTGAGLVMEFLDDVFSLPELVFADPSGEPARDELLRSAGRIVARLHRRGIGHPDLHLGNFLGNPDDSTDVRLVDLHAVHHLPVVRSPRRRRDLAKLIHSLGEEADHHSVSQVIGAYLEGSEAGFLGELEDEISLIGIESRQIERVRLRSRDRRCWKTTSQFRSERRRSAKRGKWQIHRRREFAPESLAPLLDGSWTARRTLKALPGDTMAEVELPTPAGPCTFMVRIRECGLGQGFVDRVFRGPLERAWESARRFEVRGIPHAKAFALAVEKRGGRVTRTILVTEKLEGKLLSDAVSEHSSDSRELEMFLRRAADSVAPTLRTLHRWGVHHRDTRPSSWFVLDQGPPGSSVVLLDLESIHPRRLTSLRLRRLNLIQLALLPDGVATPRLRMRFLLRYHAGERIFPAWSAALDREFATRQVAEIEARIARERALEPDRSSGPTGVAETKGPDDRPSANTQ